MSGVILCKIYFGVNVENYVGYNVCILFWYCIVIGFECLINWWDIYVFLIFVIDN